MTKRKVTALALAAFLSFGSITASFAQDPTTNDVTNAGVVIDSANSDSNAMVAEPEPAPEPEPVQVAEAPIDAPVVEQSFHEVVKEKFIEGGVLFMTPVLICLILGLGIAIERILSLNIATTNTKKLLKNVEDSLNSGGVPAATDATRSTRGPVASIFTQGLLRHNEGIDMVEKSIVSYGSVEMGKLEKGLIWISLFIALAPMLGFMGTVIGMIDAFDAIAAAGDVSPSLVAGGIKVALITTVSGLIVAILLQIFYNYCVAKMDSIINSMEDASIAFVDLLIAHDIKNGGKTVVVK